MPSLTVNLSAFQIEKATAYARRHRVQVEDVIVKALDHFLAVAEAEAEQSPDVTGPGPSDPSEGRP